MGVCFGAQYLAQNHGGNVLPSSTREYGRAILTEVDNQYSISKGLTPNSQVWMSHGDHIEKSPKGFIVTSVSKNNVISSIENKSKKIFGLQKTFERLVSR